MIYLDSSAVVKALVLEAESQAFAAWVADAEGQRLVSSSLLSVEVRRTCLRSAPRALPRVAQVLAEVAMVPVLDEVLAVASELPDPWLRSLDAIHLATALSLGPAVQAFVTYDRRLAAAASSAGLDVVSPGT